MDFENLLEIEFCWRQIFDILIIHKPSLSDHVRSHTKFGRLLNTTQKNLQILTKNFVDFQNFQKFNENRILTETNI